MNGVSDAVIQRLSDARALSLPPNPTPEYRSFIEEWLYIFTLANKFPDLGVFRGKIAERLAAIERDPKPAFDGWNTMDQPLGRLQDENIVYRGKWSQGADYENGARLFMEKYHPGESLWETRHGSESVRSETYSMVFRNLQEGVRRFAREADLMAAAADAHNAIVKTEIERSFRRIGELIGAWERAQGDARRVSGNIKPSAFDDLVGQINSLTKYTVYPHSSQIWSFAHHRSFSRLNPDETADAYRRRLS